MLIVFGLVSVRHCQIVPIADECSPISAYFYEFSGYYLEDKRIATFVGQENNRKDPILKSLHCVSENYKFVFQLMDIKQFRDFKPKLANVDALSENEAIVSKGDVRFLNILIRAIHKRNPKTLLIYYSAFLTHDEFSTIFQLAWNSYKMLDIICINVDKYGGTISISLKIIPYCLCSYIYLFIFHKGIEICTVNPSDEKATFCYQIDVTKSAKTVYQETKYIVQRVHGNLQNVTIKVHFKYYKL